MHPYMGWFRLVPVLYGLRFGDEWLQARAAGREPRTVMKILGNLNFFFALRNKSNSISLCRENGSMWMSLIQSDVRPHLTPAQMKFCSPRRQPSFTKETILQFFSPRRQETTMATQEIHAIRKQRIQQRRTNSTTTNSTTHCKLRRTGTPDEKLRICQNPTTLFDAASCDDDPVLNQTYSV